jgi:Family of unknown function (DUF6334)
VAFRVNELSLEQRLALESLLGRAISERESITILGYEPGLAISDQRPSGTCDLGTQVGRREARDSTSSATTHTMGYGSLSMNKADGPSEESPRRLWADLLSGQKRGSCKTEAAEKLFSMLSVFHAVSDQPLREVWNMFAEGSLDKIVFEFDSNSLIVAVDPSDDSIDLANSAAADLMCPELISASHSPPWNSVIGTNFGWGWITVNQQGYCD